MCTQCKACQSRLLTFLRRCQTAFINTACGSQAPARRLCSSRSGCSRRKWPCNIFNFGTSAHIWLQSDINSVWKIWGCGGVGVEGARVGATTKAVPAAKAARAMPATIAARDMVPGFELSQRKLRSEFLKAKMETVGVTVAYLDCLNYAPRKPNSLLQSTILTNLGSQSYKRGLDIARCLFKSKGHMVQAVGL